MATSRRTLTRDAPVYVACRGRFVASFNRGCPSVRHLDGRMMFEVVSVCMMNVNAPIFIVNVTCGGRLVQSSSPIVLVAPASIVRWRGVLSKPIGMLVCRLRRLR
ncbi:hypothetical protein CDL15_Pgr008639 [Punica granatum]|uniref:Uncharacterized protein n=1 Tax=Punica granatum TaxID=22663 RepID=A0A218XD75_PUNGR|nr:hypothetical protein CDL15_Pgr008639 [Punica granatum]PKI43483.1 hypothetical protein CRG98_036127 [Punica granatum]